MRRVELTFFLALDLSTFRLLPILIEGLVSRLLFGIRRAISDRNRGLARCSQKPALAHGSIPRATGHMKKGKAKITHLRPQRCEPS